MDRSLYVAMTGASANMRRQATVANNLANASTPGFKESVENNFALPVQGAGFESRVNTTIRTVGIDSRPGVVSSTGNQLDVALAQDHWLSVQDRQGNVAYTRAGNLQLTSNGQLISGGGHTVLDAGGQPIAIPPHESLFIGKDGTISIVPEGQTATGVINAGQLAVVSAPTHGLERGDDGLFRANGPAPALAEGAVVTSGALEGSNVDAAGALVEMIQLQRSYEAAVRVLQADSEIAQQANSMLSLR